MRRGSAREVRAALHAELPAHPWGRRHPGWDYTRTVSTLLEDVWPELIERYNTVIYSAATGLPGLSAQRAEGCGCGVAGGDTDACVPFTGGQDWTTAMAAAQGWPQIDDWAPCARHHQASPALSIRPDSFVAGHVDDQVAGYATNYEVNAEKNFTFITVRNLLAILQPPACCLAWLPCLHELIAV